MMSSAVFRSHVIGLAAFSALLSSFAARGLADEKINFDRQIRPILADTCFICHGPDANKRDSDLRLDVKEGAFADLGGHKAIVPGDTKASTLLQRIVSQNPDERMPPPDSGRQLSAAQIELLKKWIEQGANWEQHWAFTPIARPPLPAISNSAWPRGPIDHFVLAKLEQEQLTPTTEATKETLLRRVTIDLTGLPPTLVELDAFVADNSPDAYEQAVDRLFASPRYGERMVADWLDAARYADTNGFQGDRTRSMWPWRDGVIAALNRNQPFDQFTIEQLAGDLLPQPTLAQRIATGFHRNHMLNGEGGRIAEESRIDYVIDRVDTTAATWLGLTLGCARCHDHKYDPFSQHDYFRLFAFFNNVPETGSVDRDGSANPVVEAPSAAQQEQLAQLERRLAALVEEEKLAKANQQAAQQRWTNELIAALTTAPPGIDNFVPLAADKAREKATQLAAERFGNSPMLDAFAKQIAAATAERDRLKKQIPIVMVMQERPQARETSVLLRGSYDKFGDKVTAAVPAQLVPLPDGATANRLGLAQWLMQPSHPLTARVMVNRHWQHFLGTGLVKTAEDFGAQGERPSHPDLLDWLASEFISSGWDVKALQRSIVLSSTYRQAAKVSPALAERDPENRLLARGPRYRWPSAILRDQALAVSGLLVEQQGGPAVKPYQPPGVWEEMSFGGIRYEQDHGASLYRRSLYTFWRRTTAPTMFFDTASRQVCNVRQSRTNTPLHSLALLNDVTYLEAARVLAQRAIKQHASPADRITWMFRTITSRRPSDRERTLLTERVRRLYEHYGQDPSAAKQLVYAGESLPDEKLALPELAAYTGVASLLFNLDETLTKE